MIGSKGSSPENVVEAAIRSMDIMLPCVQRNTSPVCNNAGGRRI